MIINRVGGQAVDEDPRLGAALDRSLTVATRARTRGGKGAESTRIEYAREWAKYELWCRPDAVDGRRERWLDPTDCTPERLATYVQHLGANGVAPSTIRKAIAGIRSTLRSRGLPVPDGVPALGVLRVVEDIREEAGQGPRHAEPVPFESVVAMLLPLSGPGPTAANRRDAAILFLALVGLKIGEISALDVGDVLYTPVHALDEDSVINRETGEPWRGSTGPEPYEPPDPLCVCGGYWGFDANPDGCERGELPWLEVLVPGRTETVAGMSVPRADGRLVVPHWFATDGTHRPDLCPVEGIGGWDVAMEGFGAPAGSPWLRPIDTDDRVAGVHRGWRGTPTGLRLLVTGVREALLRAQAEARVGGRVTIESLRLAGAAAALQQGAPAGVAFAGGRWSAQSKVVGELLARFGAGEPGVAPVLRVPPAEAGTAEGVDDAG